MIIPVILSLFKSKYTPWILFLTSTAALAYSISNHLDYKAETQRTEKLLRLDLIAKQEMIVGLESLVTDLRVKEALREAEIKRWKQESADATLKLTQMRNERLKLESKLAQQVKSKWSGKAFGSDLKADIDLLRENAIDRKK